MADTERLFREALEAPEPDPASDPALMGGDAVCPTCGASAKKIQAAGGGEPPMGGGMMDGMMK
jgi:hypothetical protein